MKKCFLLITTLFLLSMNAYSSNSFAYIQLPFGTTLNDIKVISLVKNGSVYYEPNKDELNISISKDNSNDSTVSLKIQYTPNKDEKKLKFAIIYKVDEKNYVTLLSPDTHLDVLESMKENYDSEAPTEILNDYLGNWDKFPGIVLEKNMNLFAISISDTATNILGKLSEDIERYEGKSGGINPGQGNNEFELRYEDGILYGEDIKNGGLDDEGVFGYYENTSYIGFKPHKQGTLPDEDRIIIVHPDGTEEELPKSFVELKLEEGSKVKIWNSKFNKNGKANGDWYFTIVEGEIITDNDSTVVTLVEDIWTSASEEINIRSQSNSTRNRISNIKINNTSDGKSHFQITSIEE